MESANRARQEQTLLFVTIAAAAFIHISIAVSQTLLGIGIVYFIYLYRRLPFPRIWVPLLAFLLWTILADVLSPDPWVGRAQLKKFYVFLFVPLLYGVFVRQFSKVFWLVVAWAAVATASGFWGLVQFFMKYQAEKNAPEGFYIAYLRRRITGFESHWMTFGALQLTVFALVLTQYFFSNRRMPTWAYSCLLIFSAAILLSWTRGIWLASAVSVVYLLSFWRPRMLFAVPALLVVLFLVSPPSTRQRLSSLVQPRADVDSNRHRMVTFLTGLEMVKAHPWFGIGPEEIGKNFNAYVPADIPRPLPPGYYGHLHNIYVQYAAERGIPGLLLILGLIGLAMWDCVQALQRIGPARSQHLFVLHGAIVVTIGVLVGGLSEYNLGDSEVLMMFVSVLGIAYAAVDRSKPALL